jgi:hypothetical protein
MIGTISSWIDAGNLRNKVYELREENERLRVALEDIERMDKGRKTGNYAKQVLDETSENE